jgi:hypothetical protein
MVSASWILMGGSSHAQQTSPEAAGALEEIVVTAEKRSESVNSVPIYSIRGIGFNESSLGAKPDVSV